MLSLMMLKSKILWLLPAVALTVAVGCSRSCFIASAVEADAVSDIVNHYELADHTIDVGTFIVSGSYYVTADSSRTPFTFVGDLRSALYTYGSTHRLGFNHAYIYYDGSYYLYDSIDVEWQNGSTDLTFSKFPPYGASRSVRKVPFTVQDYYYNDCAVSVDFLMAQTLEGQTALKSLSPADLSGSTYGEVVENLLNPPATSTSASGTPSFTLPPSWLTGEVTTFHTSFTTPTITTAVDIDSASPSAVEEADSGYFWIELLNEVTSLMGIRPLIFVALVLSLLLIIIWR